MTLTLFANLHNKSGDNFVAIETNIMTYVTIDYGRQSLKLKTS